MNTLPEDAEIMRAILEGVATGGDFEADTQYQEIRRRLMKDSATRDHVPEFVKRARTLGDFWTYIKPMFKSYADRRTFLMDAFHPLLTELENDEPDELPAAVQNLNAPHLDQLWHRARERAATDPSGALTAARSLLESLCKLILDDAGLAYGPNDDLPKLYSAASKRMNLSPAQHSEQPFKQILQGCVSVVHGLASLRSSLGDAHGKGRRAVRPAARHAQLAVTLSGGMAHFLAETWQAQARRAAPAAAAATSRATR